MAVEITGASGFVGTILVEFLIKNNFKVKSLDLRDSNWISRLDFRTKSIIHLAGKAQVVRKSVNPKEYFEVNTKLTQDLFDAFLESNVRNFIFFSSVKAVSDQPKDYITEETATNPRTAYGQSKLHAEQYILGKALPEGKRVFILRPSIIHGPGNKGNIKLLYQLLIKGFPWPLGAFHNKRSYCSIDNVCFVIKQLIERDDIPSGVYNLADDCAISTNRLVELIAISKNIKVKIYYIPKGIIIGFAKLGDLLCIPFNSDRLEKLTENLLVSNEKIVNALGEAFPTSAEVGLLNTFKSFK